MRLERCPYCKGTVDVLDSDLGKMVQCDKVRCGKFFLVTSPVPATTADPPRLPFNTSLRPRLTGPHRCLVCQGEVNKALNRRRCTVLHRPAGDTSRDNCRMDVYAAIYFCPHCRPGTLLETPAYQWGRLVSCPECHGQFQAPRDDVLHERDAETQDGVAMSFSCPSCEAELRCDSTRRGVPISGIGVVCLHCRHLIQVPPHGERVARSFASRP